MSVQVERHAVTLAPNLVSLNVAAQVVNALMLPLVVGLLTPSVSLRGRFPGCKPEFFLLIGSQKNQSITNFFRSTWHASSAFLKARERQTKYLRFYSPFKKPTSTFSVQIHYRCKPDPNTVTKRSLCMYSFN